MSCLDFWYFSSFETFYVSFLESSRNCSFRFVLQHRRWTEAIHREFSINLKNDLLSWTLRRVEPIYSWVEACFMHNAKANIASLWRWSLKDVFIPICVSLKTAKTTRSTKWTLDTGRKYQFFCKTFRFEKAFITVVHEREVGISCKIFHNTKLKNHHINIWTVKRYL